MDSLRKPPVSALWSLTIETRFGPDFVWLEGVTRVDGSRAAVLVANETTDPIDGWVSTGITLERADLEHLRVGIDRALAWLTPDPIAAVVCSSHPPAPTAQAADRDQLGRIVRAAWVAYCIETGDTKASHITPWEDLGDWDREVDRRIGEAVAASLARTETEE